MNQWPVAWSRASQPRMNDVWLFLAAVSAILATPGPTNTLLATAGAISGVRAAIPLVWAELAAYLLAIGLWGFLLAPAMAAAPWLSDVLRLACAAYLVHCAIRLWRSAGASVGAGGGAVDARRLFVATLLNPKALLFAVAIFPKEAFAGAGAFLAAGGLFAATLAPIGAAWIALGAAAAHRRAGGSGLVQKLAAVVLAGFASVLGGGALA